VRAVAESQTERGHSVWEAVLAFIRDSQPVTGRQVHQRFHYDDAEIVTGVLNDLIHSGLTYRSGRALDAVYRIVDAADLHAQQDAARHEAEEYLVWLAIFRQGPVGPAQIGETLHLP
jgi:hypothetical protein